MVKTSGLRVPVSWSGSEQVTGLSGPFKIKITFDGPFRRALSLYAVYAGQ